MKLTTLLAVFLAAACSACSDSEDSPQDSAPAPSRDQPAAPAVPDGGVREGHGAEDDAPPPRERGSIVVPETDPTPPWPVVRLGDTRATSDEDAPRVLVPRGKRISVTVIGRDRDGGMGRARVAIRARLTCRSTAGKLAIRRFVRYVPPPQVERIRITPGTRTRTELRRTVRQRFDTTECMGGTVERFSGEAWADTTNASGLDTTSEHIFFASR